MNPIKTAKHVPFGKDLRYCYEVGIMFQADMTESIEYDKSYFKHYVDLIGSEVANKLNRGRVSLTAKYSTCLIDIGIGSGEFITSSGMKAYGYDINPCGVDWLTSRGLYVDPYLSVPPDVDGWTFWDSLEHIPEPDVILGLVQPGQHVYVSLPVFDNLLRIRGSKHYKPGEHYQYFTEGGFLWFAGSLGFEPVEISDLESEAGRENIQTFVLRKL